MLKKVKYIPQILQTECGLVNIAMLSRYYGKHIELNDLREYVQPGRDGIGISNLVKILQSLDFDCNVYKVNVEMLSGIKLPAILYIDNNHFVILEKISKRKYTVVDPALGRIQYKEEELREKFSNIAVQAVPNEKFEKVKRKQSTWKYFIPIIKESKDKLIKVTCYSMALYIINLVITSYTQKFVDHMDSISTSNVMTIMMIMLSFAIVMFLNSIESVYLKANLYKDFSEYTYEHLINAPYSFFESRSHGNLAFSLESISIVKNMYAEKMVDFFISFGGLIVLLIYLYFLSPVMGIIVVFILLSTAIILKFFSKKVLMLNQLEIANLAKLQEIQLDILYSIFNIKITGIQEQIYNLWNKKFLETNERTKKRDKMQGYYSTLSSLVQIIMPLLVLFIGMKLISGTGITLGKVMAAYTVTSLIAGYAISIFTTMNYFELSEQYLERVKDITDQAFEKNGTTMFKKEDFQEIEFRNVSFRYSPQASDVLKNINFVIKKGQKVAIVGKSGCGKSTLSKLLLNLYSVTGGEILVNGLNIEEYDKKSYRTSFGVVPQDTSLENKTIYDNIKMNREELTEENIVTACERANIAHEIEEMPMKYKTLVSDMGMNLSGGQRQRILLARALAGNPEIVIFDEATSSLDSINESYISEGLSNNKATQIIIAHRLSTIIDSDMILVFDDGCLVEYGRHSELMEHKATYYELYEKSVQGME